MKYIDSKAQTTIGVLKNDLLKDGVAPKRVARISALGLTDTSITSLGVIWHKIREYIFTILHYFS